MVRARDFRSVMSWVGLAVAVVLTWSGLSRRSIADEGELRVVADFEGGSVRDVAVDAGRRTISFAPGGDPDRGWPCWWCFRVEGTNRGEPLTLRLRGSSAVSSRPGAKPLASSWAMPLRATWSEDGREWRHTAEGRRDEEWMVYEVRPSTNSVYVAWGPPFTPSDAERLVRELAESSPLAVAEELCKSRGGRRVPLLHVRDGESPGAARRFGVWVQARQHAWESGSSWVARGFAEWLVGPTDEAAWLRRNAELFVVPIMDVDNAATGNGGKDALPQDHNRDWSDEPHWHEVRAAQQRVRGLVAEGRLDVFLDLHNPAPGDPSFFYVLPADQLPQEMVVLRDRFIELAYGRISKIRPLVPMSNQPKPAGPGYHPLWRQISANWASVHGNPHTVGLCLETGWNNASGNTESYRSVGARLAESVADFLRERR